MHKIKSKVCMVLSTISMCGQLFAGGPGKLDASWNNGFIFEAGAIYGVINDSGISQGEYVQTSSSNNANYRAYLPDMKNDWGWTASIGIYLTPDKEHDLIFSYTNLSNKYSNNISAANITNTFGQFSDSFSDGSVHYENDFNYQSYDLLNHNRFKTLCNV